MSNRPAPLASVLTTAKGAAQPPGDAAGRVATLAPSHPGGLAAVWAGKDAPVKLSVDVPERIIIKLGLAKSLRLLKHHKDLVAEAVEKRVDELLAQHQSGG